MRGSLPSLSSMSALEATPISVPSVSNMSTKRNANIITTKSSRENTMEKSIFIKVGIMLGTEIPFEKSGAGCNIQDLHLEHTDVSADRGCPGSR